MKKTEKIPAKLFAAILESIGEGVFTIDKHFKITSFNRAAEDITGFRKEEAIGKYCYEIFRTNICLTDCALKKTLKTGRNISGFELNILDRNNKEIPVIISTAVLKDSAGNFLGGVETFRDISAIKNLNNELKNKYKFCDIVSKNKEIRNMFSLLTDISKTDVNILLCGETGTGKELFANAIHNISPRKDGPFVVVNCAAIPENLIEAELFGYKKGSFTNAYKDNPGKFKLAHKGTIFLDEIGEIPFNLQAKLLRVLQEKEFYEIGGNSVIKPDVRIIAATNKNLEKLVKQNLFREDLFYRLAVMKLEIPPIRERREDIPLLIEHFINIFNVKYNKRINKFNSDAMKILLNYDYPGNVRELQNIVEHCCILSKGEIINKDNLPQYLIKETLSPEESDIYDKFQKMKQQEIKKILKKTNYNLTEAAKLLHIHRTTLYRWIKKYNIQ